MSHDGLGLRAVMRSVTFLTATVLAVPLLAACGSDDEAGKPLAAQDIASAGRARVADGGTLHWAADDVPETFNSFQADADATTNRVAQAVLPAMFRLDASGRPRRDADYLESAKVVDTEPKQVVLYRLNQQAVWSDGREIGAADFAAQWRALSGKDSAYWTARNAGYDRIEKVERGRNDLEVRVTFARPYADWRSLFSPLYPKDVMGTPDAFNDGARRKLKVTAGPFALKKVDRKTKTVTLARSPRWWGRPAKLSEIVLTAVPREERASALAAGKLDLAEIDPADARRIETAAKGSAGADASAPGAVEGTGAAKKSGKADPGEKNQKSENSEKSEKSEHADDEQQSGDEQQSDGETKSDAEKKSDAGEEGGGDEEGTDGKASRAAAAEDALRGLEVRRSLEPAYTQLALNGSEGPLADERVRRAVARALDRKELAKLVLRPLGLPAEPVGSHLALSGQAAYADNSGALGGQDTAEARALLGDAGWVPGGPVDEEKTEKAAGGEGEKSDRGAKSSSSPKAGKKGDSDGDDDGTYIVGEDDKGRRAGGADGKDQRSGHDGRHLAQDGRQWVGRELRQGSVAGAYAPRGTAAPAGAASGVLAKDGKALDLRFVLPSGEGSETLRAVAERISAMLVKVGIRTRITKVSEASYFKDHIASGQYDLALYSWPASAFPATDARPIYAKPVPAADGSLTVEQNYTRVGTDQVDQLFDRAVATLDEDEARDLLRKADSRIWAAAGSIPLYQRPQLVAARKDLVNAGAFGFRTPVYEDMGFLKKGAVRDAASPSKK
ncbi:ABC transporter family substrate-binding protein [Streptomyces galbus]|uniref:ABC transporter family substrate-binding protein n=1 Tax=Streptomyces galbus TaxID=33898 RepID=A0ABX1IGH7_STRGB|nr:ABC transporter family substrate-binding protein [Streptomyces galbus]NKQ24507.1 ABC transporter family substrate-binding protein [Streptomyces galbus]